MFTIKLKRTKAGIEARLSGGDPNSTLDALAEQFRLHSDEGSEIELGVAFFELSVQMGTDKMLRYLWGHLAVVLLRFMQEGGESISSKYLAVEKMKRPLGYTEDILLKDDKIAVVNLSLSNKGGGSRAKKAQFIQDLRMFLLEQGCRVQTPDEYFKTKRIT